MASERRSCLHKIRAAVVGAGFIGPVHVVGDAARRFIHYPGGHNEGFPDTFKQCFRAFYGAIADGSFRTAPAYPTFADGHREILLCEAILRSHRKGGWVRV